MSKKLEKLQKYSAPALEKGLDILEFLSLSEVKPTLSEIASAIDRSKSEIFRMMIVLEERGYIQRFDGDTYTITDRLAVLGAHRSFNSRLSELAQPHLKQLSDATGFSNHLSVLDDRQMLVIANMDAPQSYGLSLQIGFRADLAGSGTAACLLVDRPDSSDVIAGLSPSDRDAFVKLSEDCSANGHVLSQNPQLDSVLELSAPVKVGDPLVSVAAVTLALLNTRTLHNIVPDMVAHLQSSVEALGRKIDIVMPSLASRADLD